MFPHLGPERDDFQRLSQFLPRPQIHLWEKFHKDPFNSFYVKSLTTDRHTNAAHYVTLLVQVKMQTCYIFNFKQKHNRASYHPQASLHASEIDDSCCMAGVLNQNTEIALNVKVNFKCHQNLPGFTLQVTSYIDI